MQPVRVVVPKWKAHRAPLAGEQGEETPNFTNFVGSLYIIKLSARVSSARAAWCGVCGNESKPCTRFIYGADAGPAYA